jgi:hypothetical protein
MRLVKICISVLSFWLILSIVGNTSIAGVITDCDRVKVTFDDQNEQALAEKVAGLLCKSINSLDRSLRKYLPHSISLRITGKMDGFLKITGRPWFVSAAIVNGSIVTQPANNLRKLADLEGTLAHELIHLLVRRLAGRNCPRWLDEGLAQRFGNKILYVKSDLVLPENEEQLQELEKRLQAGSKSPKEMQKDYELCLGLVLKAVDCVGLKNVYDLLNIDLEGVLLKDCLFKKGVDPD